MGIFHCVYQRKHDYQWGPLIDYKISHCYMCNIICIYVENYPGHPSLLEPTYDQSNLLKNTNLYPATWIGTGEILTFIQRFYHSEFKWNFEGLKLRTDHLIGLTFCSPLIHVQTPNNSFLSQSATLHVHAWMQATKELGGVLLSKNAYALFVSCKWIRGNS